MEENTNKVVESENKITVSLELERVIKPNGCVVYCAVKEEEIEEYYDDLVLIINKALGDGLRGSIYMRLMDYLVDLQSGMIDCLDIPKTEKFIKKNINKKIVDKITPVIIKDFTENINYVKTHFEKCDFEKCILTLTYDPEEGIEYETSSEIDETVNEMITTLVALNQYLTSPDAFFHIDLVFQKGGVVFPVCGFSRQFFNFYIEDMKRGINDIDDIIYKYANLIQKFMLKYEYFISFSTNSQHYVLLNKELLHMNLEYDYEGNPLKKEYKYTPLSLLTKRVN